VRHPRSNSITVCLPARRQHFQPQVCAGVNQSYDRKVKMPQYARYGVRYAWLIDPISKWLEAYVLEDGNWIALPVAWDSDKTARIPPFDAIDLFVPWD
jgi:hypothetical protein